jgi:hypothetical protein
MYKLVLCGLICASLMSVVSCTKIGDKDGSGQVSATEYNRVLKNYNDQVDDYNKLVHNGVTSDGLLIETGSLIKDLNDKAADVRAQAKAVRQILAQSGATGDLKAGMQLLDRKIQDALTIVAKLEQQTSKKNVRQVADNSELSIKESARPTYNLRALALGDAMMSLTGLRDLLLSQYNDLVDQIGAHLRDQGALAVAAIDPSREGNLVPENQSPVVASLEAGGRVTGVARDSVSGAPISYAFVGYKKKQESTDYFYSTTTDARGEYATPYLLPGTYYVDVKRDGYIHVDSQPVQIRRGQESSENISLSEPVGDDAFRVTLSWTNEKPGAVRDVDSYLMIPGVLTPLSFQTKGYEYNGAFLDRDDTNWIGPETVTIHQVRQGTYIYYVNNFNLRTDRSALGRSDVRVKLYKGQQLVQSFEVPQGVGLSYELFRIENGEVRVTGLFNDNLPMN